MSRISKLLEELEDKLASSNTDIIECLKKARIIAKYFNDLEILEWIDLELKGYPDFILGDLPNYRKIRVIPFQRRVLIQMGVRYTSDEALRLWDSHPVSISISQIQQWILNTRKSEKDTISLVYNAEIDGKLNQISIKVSIFDLESIITEINSRLSDYIYEKQEIVSQSPYNTPLMKIFNKFHRIAKQLEQRRENRATLKINDEYDVQDLLHGLLSLEFDSIQKEEYGPQFANKRPRIDFFLRYENTAIEVKKIRDKNHAKSVRDEIIKDKEEYSQNKQTKYLYFFIYDPDSLIIDRVDFVEDLTKNIPKQFDDVKIIIKPDI